MDSKWLCGFSARRHEGRVTAQPIDRVRRSLVLGGSAFAGLTAAGCCAVRPHPEIAGICKPQPQPFLAGPEVLAAWKRPERFFDAHTHFFNARDVPVEGFLSKSVAHGIEPENVRRLVIALAPIAALLAEAAMSPADEMRDLCQRSGRMALSLTDRTAELDQEIERRSKELAKQLFEAIERSGSEVPTLINDASERARAAGIRALSGQPLGYSMAFIEQAFRDGGSVRDRNTNKLRRPDRTTTRAEEAELFNMKAVLQFVRFMLSPRHHNLRKYIQSYAEQSPELPLSGCFASMVDFNYWLDCPAKASHMEDQLRLHEQLALLSQGFLIPLVAYNPWVDIKEDNASIRLVEKAIKYHGCVGVKVYPPMGFYPYDNVHLPLITAEDRPDPTELDKKLAALYELCENLGVPVMAHANASNGRDVNHDALAGVAGWQAVRDQVTILRALYINAGHFGGALKHQSVDWTDNFVTLMREEGRLRVFADLGYWNELLDKPEVSTKLERELRTPLPGGNTVADRVMYGSDWLMLSKEPGWESYAQAVANIIRSMDASGAMAAKVLGANALKCFGLTKDAGRPSFERYLKYHNDNSMGGAPGWV